MTPDQVKAAVEQIRVLADRHGHRDEEGAHILEDRLFADVLKAIADGSGDAMELAREALKSRELGFARWMS